MTEEPQYCACAVIVAVFNGAEYLSQALGSITEQTLLPRQIIIVDDGSSDDSPRIISQFVDQFDSAFDIVTLHQSNQGQSSARNFAIEFVNQEFVAFLDQDDIWKSFHLANLLQSNLFNSEIGWVYSDFDLIDQQAQILVANKLVASGYLAPDKQLSSLLSKDLMMLPTASVIRSNAIESVGGFDTQFKGFEDDDLFVRMFIRGFSFAFLEESTIQYRTHETNSSGGISFAQSRMKFFEKYRDYFSSLNQPDETFISQVLAPRTTSGVLHDLFVARRAGNTESEVFALDNLNYLFNLRGLTLKRRAILLVVKIRPLFQFLYRANLKKATYMELKKYRQQLRDKN